jgi:hypothetical protein
MGFPVNILSIFLIRIMDQLEDILIQDGSFDIYFYLYQLEFEENVSLVLEYFIFIVNYLLSIFLRDKFWLKISISRFLQYLL